MATINPYTNRFDFGGKLEIDGDIVANIVSGTLRVTSGLRKKETIIDNGTLSETVELEEVESEIELDVRLAQDLTTGTPVPTVFNRLKAAGTDGQAKRFAFKFYFRRGRNSTVGWSKAFAKVYVPEKGLPIASGSPSDILSLKLRCAESEPTVASETFA